jgi:hypothetical protein
MANLLKFACSPPHAPNAASTDNLSLHLHLHLHLHPNHHPTLLHPSQTFSCKEMLERAAGERALLTPSLTPC